MDFVEVFVLLAFGLTLTSSKKPTTLEFGADCTRTTAEAEVELEDHSTCNRQAGLQCSIATKKCVCNQRAYYDKNGKHCVTLVGSACNKDSKCTSDATCKSYNSGDNPSSRVPASIQKVLHDAFSSGQTKICTCPSGSIPDKNRKTCVAVAQYGDACSEKKKIDCDQSKGLICGSEKTCTCNETSTSVYFEAQNRCISPLGTECDGQTQCTENAICSSLIVAYRAHLRLLSRYSGTLGDSSAYISVPSDPPICACVPGFSENSKGECVASLGVQCSSENPCNKDAFLSCVGGQCQCDQGTTAVFEPKAMACRLLPGSACLEKKGPKCAVNSECDDGLCKCSQDFKESVSGTCMRNFGTKCGAPDVCNNFQGLACRGSKCDCFDSSLKWNKKLGLCTAKEGAPCGNFNLTQNLEVQKNMRLDPLYPSIATETSSPSYYSVACENGFICTEEPKLGMGYNRCKKEKS